MKKLIALLVSLILCLAPAGATEVVGFAPVQADPQGRFHDVTPSDWFFADVGAVYELGLMNGTGADAFSPQGTVDLATAITLCARLRAGWYGDDVPLVQAPEGLWYDVYVRYAVDRGFWSPGAETDYTAPISRGALAALLCAALPQEAFPALGQVDDGAIPDVGRDYPQRAAIYTLYRAGVLTGQGSDGAFRPDSLLTRAELAAVTMRAADPTRRQSVALTPAPAPTDTSAQADPRQEILDLVNQARNQEGLSPLALDPDLSRAAQVRAEESAQQFSHTRPDGTDCLSLLEALEIDWRSAGENLAMGQSSPQEAMEDWMDSPGHRANILTPDFGRLGVAHYEKEGTRYWVQLFAD